LPGRRRPFGLALGLLLVTTAGAVTLGGPAAGRPATVSDGARAVRLQLQTELGDVLLEIDTARAPLTAANFLRYVDAGRYDGGLFHRALTRANQAGKAAPVELVQAGVAARHRGRDFAPIAMEPTARTGLRHLDGTLSMARDDADSATSQFFVALGAQPSLDAGGRRHPDGRGFAAFGRVTAGLEVLRRIQAAPLRGERLVTPVRILRIVRVP
jgi:peptidyl-prolyl cis-trans isomerase A (cyclophilin A)